MLLNFVKNKYLKSYYLFQKKVELLSYINVSVSRAALNINSRIVREYSPQTWEASGFSQNGEDGIIDFLLNKLIKKNKYFVEIGSGNGIENNTSYLAHIKKYSGLHIEGSYENFKDALITKAWLVECHNCFVNNTSIPLILSKCLYLNPDVFSIDIDGMDYFITKQLFDNGFSPSIIVVEYNSAFGPEKSVTINYDENFSMFNSGYPYLYYGVSIKGWRNFFSKFGYQFITVESNGVNAFFVKEELFDKLFLNQLKGTDFAENVHQLRLFKNNWEGQFDLIKNMRLTNI